MPMEMKEMIARTFARMVSEKGMDNVTVKSLVEACHISRQTFYYHFQDLMDVIEWAMDQTLHQVLEEALVNQKPEEALQIFVEFAVKNRELLKKMLDSQRREQIEGMLFATARKYLRGLLETATPRLSMNYSDMDLLLDFWAGGFTGVLLQQCRKKQVDAKKLTDQIQRILTQRMLGVRQEK